MKRFIPFCLLSLCAIGAFFSIKDAKATYTPYNMNNEIFITSYSNNTDHKKIIYAGTRPTEGKGGVIISIRKANGDVMAEKLFSYYADVPMMYHHIGSGQVRNIYVRPNLYGQTCKGNVNHYMQDSVN
ncbi:MAG: hypothetical protein VZR00_07795 [Lachnospiraceae bacterium]|jgi:hypothetical protein|nr:hypothetical protein [Lachnospiraceae bacterium]MEE3461769.1 hypothetical protein [Lachnospiraceae bacterium]